MCPGCGCELQIPAAPGAPPLQVAGPAVAPRAAAPAWPAAPPPLPPQGTAPGQEGPLPNHGGGAIPADADFFVGPPQEIGPVFSANTTLSRYKQPLSLEARLGWIFGCVLGA